LRNIHAELENWDQNAPIEWKPSTGDILIGVVTGCPTRGPGLAVESVTIQQEQTDILVAVSLDSPHLANLFKLQRPHPGERIGIKCLEAHPDSNESRFVLMVDRAEVDGPADEYQPLPLDESEDPDSAVMTEQERLFIEEALIDRSDDASDPPDNDPEPALESAYALRTIMRHQQEEIARQVESLRGLESMLAQAIPLIASAPPAPHLESAAPSGPTSVDSASAIPENAQGRKRRVNWMLLFLVFLTSCSLGVAVRLLFELRYLYALILHNL